MRFFKSQKHSRTKDQLGMKEEKNCWSKDCIYKIEEPYYLLRPHSYSDVGEWTSLVYCEINDDGLPIKAAVGFKFSWEPSQGGGGGGNDDSGGNGFWLICGDPLESGDTDLIGFEGRWNDASETHQCEEGSYLFAIQVQSEIDSFHDIPRFFSFTETDHMGLTNVKLWCKSLIDGSEKSLPVPDAPGPDTWTKREACPEYYAITGVMLKMQEYQGDGDDTMLNQIRLVCQRVLSILNITDSS